MHFHQLLHYAQTNAKAAISCRQAAEVFNVSREFLVKLLDNGEIPSHKTGAHRRVLLSDVLEYKNTSDAKRHRVLDELVQQAQELNMGYE